MPNLGLYWNGVVDDLRLYDRALSETEIADAMKGIGPARGQTVLPNPVAAGAGASTSTTSASAGPPP